MEKSWIIKEQADSVIIKQLMKATNVPENIARLMVQRGITTSDEAKVFFEPGFNSLHDPLLVPHR